MHCRSGVWLRHAFDSCSGDGCDGCGRVYGEDHELHDPEQLVEWYLPNGRGRWCKICHDIYRHALEETVFLPDLKGWIREFPSEWRMFWIAKMSLLVIQDSPKKITPEIFAAKVAEYQRILGMLGCGSNSVFGLYLALESVDDMQADAPARGTRVETHSVCEGKY